MGCQSASRTDSSCGEPVTFGSLPNGCCHVEGAGHAVRGKLPRTTGSRNCGMLPSNRTDRALLRSRQAVCQLPNPHLCGCHFLPLDSRRVAPKVFQAVKGAFVAVKDMHNHLQII